MRICKILGHKWNKTNQYEQKCLRKGCSGFRYLHWKRFPEIGEPQVDWTILDTKMIKFKK